MRLLGKCGRTLFNVLLLRGRKRRPIKILVILLLLATVFVFGMSGLCILDSQLCAEGEDKALLQRTRAQFGDYEVNQNPWPHRNIKGGRNEQNFDNDGDSNFKHPLGQPVGEKPETQMQLPPAVDRDQQLEGDDRMLIDNQYMVKPRTPKVDDNSKRPRIDDQTMTEPKSPRDQSPVVERNKHGNENDPTGDQHTRDPTPKETGRVSIKPQPNGAPVEENKAVVQHQPSTELKHGTVVEQVPLIMGDEGRPPNGETIDNTQPQVALEEGDQLPVSQGEKPVIMTKTKTEVSEVVPVEVDSNGPNDQLPVDPKSKMEAQPSLSPRIVARPKKEESVNVPSSDGGQANGVRTLEKDANNGVKVVPKGALPDVNGGGGGGGGGEKQMTAAEMAKAIENGEMCKTVCPPFVWSDWSPCSKACGRGRQYRKALYKFVCQSSELCPLNRIEESVCETPCKFDPEKYGGPNGLDMYPINPLNPAMYPEDRKYMCGHWLVEYEKLHQDILSGKKPPRYLVYSTGKGTYPTAGGIAPRIRGITTTFFLAVLLDRAFMIEWLDPPGLDQYLEPKSFNWADLSKLENLKRGPVRDIGSWRSAKESSISSQWYMSTNFSTYFTNDVEIVQGHRYDFTYAVLRNPELMPKAFELGVDQIKCRICCAFHMLFRMTEKFQQQMDTLLTSLGAPQKSIGAIQLRTKSHNVQDSVKYAEAFVKCATKAAKGLKMSSRLSWVPIFNNRLVVHIVHKKYGDKLKLPINIDSATRTVHTHLGNLPADTEVEVAKAVQERTFKDFFLTINSTVIIRKKGYEGSFGNIADAIRRFYHERGSVHSFLVGKTCTKFPDTYKIE